MKRLIIINLALFFLFLSFLNPTPVSAQTCNLEAINAGYSSGFCVGCTGIGCSECPPPNEPMYGSYCGGQDCCFFGPGGPPPTCASLGGVCEGNSLSSCGPGGALVFPNTCSGQICCSYGGGGGGGGGGGPPPPPPTYDISGIVFVDTNGNGIWDAGEGVYPGLAVHLAGYTSTTNAGGSYFFGGFLSGNYTVSIAVPANYINTTPTSVGISIGPDRTVNFGIAPVYSINGTVVNDINKNYVLDNASEYYGPGATIGASRGSVFVNSIGQYVLNNLLAGTYTLSLTSPLPAGYQLRHPLTGPPPTFTVTVGPGCTSSPVNPNPAGLASCNGRGDVANLNFIITNSLPWLQAYALDMRIDNGLTDPIPQAPIYPPYASAKDSTSTGPPPPPTLISQGTIPATNPSGATVYGLSVGQLYRIVVSGTFEFSNRTNPHLVSDAQWSNVGTGVPNCFCVRAWLPYFNGNVYNASDLGPTYTPSHTYTFPWTADSTQLTMQILDSNYTDNTGSLTYQMYLDPSPPPPAQGTTPGVVFLGSGPADFGSGQASINNWVVGNALYPELFSYSSGGISQVSYQYLLSQATRAGITPINMTTLAGCSNLANCTLPNGLTNGVYQANGDVTLNAHNFNGNKNYIFLINGTLTINGNITVGNNDTALFATNRDIVVASSVGAANNVYPLPATQVEGIYSASRNFTVQGINNCITGKDKMLDVGGAIVVNAAGAGGTFANQRDLCGDNPTIPSFTISPRLDFVLNAPSFLTKSTTLFREDAP